MSQKPAPKKWVKQRERSGLIFVLVAITLVIAPDEQRTHSKWDVCLEEVNMSPKSKYLLNLGGVCQDFIYIYFFATFQNTPLVHSERNPTDLFFVGAASFDISIHVSR